MEHNYPVGPAKTNCDSLQIKGLGFDETLSRIENTTFRFHQKFKNSRLNGVQAGQFYSCDGGKGFLLLTVDKKKTIFREVPKSVWDSLVITTDPDQFYMEKVRDEFPGIPEN
ncbi:MAG: hypothetical protein KFF73_09520 [Cyclobacteriaceae bacterium]|nr:hypothetical protein [Cyclobacteriaceae bacterium]